MIRGCLRRASAAPRTPRSITDGMDGLLRRFRLKCPACPRWQGPAWRTGRYREKADGILACGPLARSADGYPGSMPEMPRTLTAALHREEDWFIAQCLEVDVASQGHTRGRECSCHSIRPKHGHAGEVASA